MMATAKSPKLNVDFAALQAKVTSQFKDLNPNDPSVWPAVPRYGLCILLCVLVVVGLWFAWLQGVDEQLKADQATEVKLREEYTQKLAKAINLASLKEQRRQVLQSVNQLEKELPSKAEMDALLSDINQAGVGRSLQFDLFRPGSVTVREYYAELPIDVKLVGRYHDIGAFAADIASLSRIVTLNNLVIAPVPDGNLSLTAVAKTFRYLDPEEVAAQRKASAPKGKK
jgi:type IV pilus assembly protein PilO